MTDIAFYAPLKSPNHCVASGDRQIALNFISLIELMGYQLMLASEYRSWEGEGNIARQNEIKNDCLKIAQNLVIRYQENSNVKPKLWFTYHCYHKAPDWIGLHVCEKLNIPYVIAEFSISKKQCDGKWSDGYQATIQSLKIASAIIIINEKDLAEIKKIKQQLDLKFEIIKIKPFLIHQKDFKGFAFERQNNKIQLAKSYSLNAKKHWIICVAQMRNDSKWESYKLLMKSVDLLIEKQDTQLWQLVIVGGGVMFNKLKSWSDAINSHYQNQIALIGETDNQTAQQIMTHSRIMFWPAVNEAIGIIFLESLKNQLPVVTSAISKQVGGVNNVVYDNETALLIEDFDVNKMSDAIAELINNDSLYLKFHQQSAEMYAKYHHQNITIEILKKLFHRLTNGDKG